MTPWKWLALAALVLLPAGFLVVQSTAFAQLLCGEHRDLASRLQKKHGEAKVAEGVSNSAKVELYVSREGTWTILIIGRPGRACMPASGEGWRFIKPARAPDERS